MLGFTFQWEKCSVFSVSASLCWRNNGSRAKERGKIPQHPVKSRGLHTTQSSGIMGLTTAAPSLLPAPLCLLLWCGHTQPRVMTRHISHVFVSWHILCPSFGTPFPLLPYPSSAKSWRCVSGVITSPPGVGPLLMIPIPRPPQRSTVSIQDPCCMISSSDLPVPHWNMTSFPAPCMAGRSVVQGMKQEYDINH